MIEDNQSEMVMHECCATIEYQMDARDWLQGLIVMAAGEGSDIKVGAISSDGFDYVEITGSLPRPLRKGLRRYARACEIGEEPEYAIDWRTKPDGYGATFAIESLDDAIGLIAKRKRFFAEKEVPATK